MAIRRSIDTSLWHDPLILDKFNKEDKLFWLYCLTNPHNNLCGTSIISPKLMAMETGLEENTIKDLIEKFSNTYNRIQYNFENNEMLILKWHKYNWTKSNNVKQSLYKQINEVKTDAFKDIIQSQIDSIDWSERSNGK